MTVNYSKYIFIFFLLFIPYRALANCKGNLGFINSKYQETFKSGVEHQLNSRHLLAVIDFKLSEAMSCNKEQKFLSIYHQSKSLIELDEKGEAIKLLNKINLEADSQKLKEKSRLLIAFHNKEKQSQLLPDEKKLFFLWENRRHPEQLKKELDSSSLKENKANQLYTLSRELENNAKKPWVAGTASAFLPGLGQVYNGHYQSAAMSFILNALFLGSTLEFAKRDQLWATLTAGTVWSVVYVGGIVSAVRGSQKSNQLNSLEKELKFQNILFEF